MDHIVGFHGANKFLNGPIMIQFYKSLDFRIGKNFEGRAHHTLFCGYAFDCR